jgi:N utilization substance protein B
MAKAPLKDGGRPSGERASGDRPQADRKVNREERPANKRGAARFAAVQALYQMEIGGTELADVLAEFQVYRLGKEMDGLTFREADHHYFVDLVAGVVASQTKVDPAVHVALVEDWPLKRVDATLRAILRVGAFELMAKRDVPARVVISEFIDIAKAFFVEDEPKLVNGVLDRLAHQFRPEEFEDKA